MLTSAVNTLCKRKAIFCWYLGILTNSLRTLLLVDTSSQLLLYDEEFELRKEDKCLRLEEVFNISSRRCFSACNLLRASSVSVISSCVSLRVSGAFIGTEGFDCWLSCDPDPEVFFNLLVNRDLTMSRMCTILPFALRVSSFLMCVLSECFCPYIFSVRQAMCNWWTLRTANVINTSLISTPAVTRLPVGSMETDSCTWIMDKPSPFQIP